MMIQRSTTPWLNHFLLPAFTLLLLTFTLTTPLTASGQEGATTTDSTVVDEPPEPLDDLGRDTPFSSIVGFATAAEAFEWDIAARYLDLRNLPSGVRQISGSTLAEELYFILQRRDVKIDKDLISDKPEGHKIDDLPDYRDHLAQLDTVNGPVDLLMQRVPNRDGMMIWKVSNKTVAQIPALYEEFSYPEWVERVRSFVPENKSFLGFELFKWVICLAGLVVLIPIGWVFFYLLARLISGPKSPIWPEVRILFTGPVLGIVIAQIFRNLMFELGVGATAYRVLEARTIETFLFLWFIWKVVDIWRARRRYRYESEGRSDAAVLGRPMANAIKLVSSLLAILVWLANTGIDISALLAGLGIGGIAVALALQKPIEDLFGAVSIYSQQPVSTGDLCRYGDSVGVVEEIGLRTTRIRTLSNTLVNVPNAQLSTGIIENLTARQKIIYHPELPLRYDTTRDQLLELIPALENMLKEQPGIEEKSIRVRLSEFGQNAIIVKIRVFALTREFEEYLGIVQAVNLEIMQLMTDHGVSFSQGAQTLFIKRGDSKAPQ